MDRSMTTIAGLFVATMRAECCAAKHRCVMGAPFKIKAQGGAAPIGTAPRGVAGNPGAAVVHLSAEPATPR